MANAETTNSAMADSVTANSASDDDAAAASAATLRVERGEPTPEELAALLAVIATRSTVGDEPAAPPKSSAWTDRSRYVRRGLSHSPDGWRTSAFPH